MVSRRERQQIEAIALFVTGQGPRSYALIREHLGDYPRDMLMLRVAQRLGVLGCSGAGIASFPAPLLALMQGVASAYGDDWAFLGQYAFAHHETAVDDRVPGRHRPATKPGFDRVGECAGEGRSRHPPHGDVGDRAGLDHAELT